MSTDENRSIATTRYGSSIMNLPDVGAMCRGQCEGTGVIPVDRFCEDPALSKLWDEAEAASRASDGYHFVTCPDCGGTGLRSHGKDLNHAEEAE